MRWSLCMSFLTHGTAVTANTSSFSAFIDPITNYLNWLSSIVHRALLIDRGIDTWSEKFSEAFFSFHNIAFSHVCCIVDVSSCATDEILESVLWLDRWSFWSLSLALASCKLISFSLGPQELKVLVDLAIISAGETDIETARITCLHTSCLGFAPLIFDLKPSFGFKKLMKTCDPVWSAVDTDPTLPDKLVSPFMLFPWFICYT